MSKSKPITDGGPAFPLPDNVGTLYHGMSLRDWFAASASDADIDAMGECAEWWKPLDRAAARYMHADAMLVAREKSHAE